MARDLRNNPRTPPLVPILLKEQREQMEFLETQRQKNFRALCGDNNIINSSRQSNRQQTNNNSKIVDKFAQALGNPNIIPANGGNLLAVPQRPSKNANNNMIETNDQQSSQFLVSVQVHVNGPNMTFNNNSQQQQPPPSSPSRRRDQAQKSNILFDRFQVPQINVEQPEPRSVHSLQVPTFGQGKQQQARQRAISDGVESSPSQDNRRPRNLFQNRNSANQQRRATAKRNGGRGQSSQRGNMRGSHRDYNFDGISSSSSSEDGQHINPMLWRRPAESIRHKPSSPNQRKHQYQVQSSSLSPHNRPQGVAIESGPFNRSIPSQVATPIFAKQDSPPQFVELPLISQLPVDNTFFQISSEHMNPQSFQNQLAQQAQQQQQVQQQPYAQNAIQVMPLQQNNQHPVPSHQPQQQNTVAVSSIQNQNPNQMSDQPQSLQVQRANSQQGSHNPLRGLQRQQSMFGNYSGSLESLIDKLQVWSQGSSKEKAQSLLSGYLLNSMLICLSMILFAVYFLVSSDPSSEGQSHFTPVYAMLPLAIIELRSGWLQFQRILNIKRTEHSLIDQVNRLVQFQENEESAIVKELIRKKSWTLIVDQFKNLIESSCRILLYLTVTVLYYLQESEMGGYTLAAIWLCLGLIQRLLWIRFIRSELNTYSKIACLVLKLLLVVQMLNVALRLDKHIEWRWEAVMWPVYIILSLAMVCSVSSTLLCIGQVFTAIFRGQSAENYEDHQRRRRLRAQGIEEIKPQQFQFCFSFWAFYMVNGFTISALLSLLKLLKLMNAVSDGDFSELYSGFLAGLFPAIYLLGVIALTLMNFSRIKYWIADHVFKEKGGLQLMPGQGDDQLNQTRRRFLGPLEVERRHALENSEDRHSHHHSHMHNSSSGRHTISSSESISSSDEEHNEDSRSEPPSESTIPGEFDDMPRFMMLVSTGSGAYFKTLKDFLFRGYGGIMGLRKHSQQSGTTTVKSKPLKLDIAGKVMPDLHLSAIREQVEERMEMDEEAEGPYNQQEKECTNSLRELMDNKLNQSQEQGDPGQRVKTQKKRAKSIAKRFQINAKRLRELQNLETSSAREAAAAKIGPMSLSGSQGSLRCQKQGKRNECNDFYNYSPYDYAGFNYSDDDASKASNALGSSLFGHDGKISGKEKGSLYPQHQYTELMIKNKGGPAERQQSGAQQTGFQSGQDTSQIKQQYTSQMLSKLAFLNELTQQFDGKNIPEGKEAKIESQLQFHQKIDYQVNTGEMGFIGKHTKKAKKHVIFGRLNSLDEEDLKMKKMNDADKLHPKLLLDVNIEMLKSQRRQLKRLEEEVKKVASIKDLLRLECLICLTATADAVIMPCGHGGLCFECGQSLCANTDSSNKSVRCHLCRKRIHSILQLDLAIFQDRRNTMSLPGSGGSALMIPVLRYLDLRDPGQPQIKNVKDEQRRINLSTRKNNESDLTYKHNQQNTSLLRIFQPPDDIGGALGLMNKDLESLPAVEEGTNNGVNSGMMVIGIDIRNNYAVFQSAEMKNCSRVFATENFQLSEDAQGGILNLCNIELIPAESPFPHQSHLNSPAALENSSIDIIRPETRSNNYLPQRANIGRCLKLLSPQGEDSDDNRFNDSNTTHSIEDASCKV